jgi:hypothetical protein
MYSRIKDIEKELGHVVYSKTRTQSMLLIFVPSNRDLHQAKI